MGKPIRIKGPGARHLSAGLQRTGPTRSQTLNALGPLIYAARTRDGLVKIGFTRHLAQRMGEFGGLGSILAVRLGCTLEDEQELHDSLQMHVARGREYYHPTETIVATVNQMRSDLGMPPMTGIDLAA